MAELLLIRHGQASFGEADYDELSGTGRLQASALGDFLRKTGWSPDRLITGTLNRQRQTLEEMGFDQQAEEHSGFNEYDFDDLLKAQHGDAIAGRKQLGHKAFFGTLRQTVFDWQEDKISGVAETWYDFSKRTAEAMHFATATHARRVVVISSGGVIGRLIADTLRAPAQMMMELNLQIKNSAMTRFVFSQDRRMLQEFNATPHCDFDPSLLTYA
jgi:broad specificity phosphatase PhoE